MHSLLHRFYLSSLRDIVDITNVTTILLQPCTLQFHASVISLQCYTTICKSSMLPQCSREVLCYTDPIVMITIKLLFSWRASILCRSFFALAQKNISLANIRMDTEIWLWLHWHLLSFALTESSYLALKSPESTPTYNSLHGQRNQFYPIYKSIWLFRVA